MARLYVGNLPTGLQERDLEEEFTKFGTLRSVWVARNPPGFAFVDFDDMKDAEDAVQRMDGFRGWRVEFSRKRDRGDAPRRGGYGGRGGGGDRYRGRSPPRARYDSPPRARRRSPSYDGYRRSPSPVRRRRSPSYGRRSTSR
eukprot:jgi/Botrbrau1/22985/Bobra.0030s0051.1